MRTVLRILAAVGLVVLGLAAGARGQSRIAEIVDIEGVRENQIRGIGLVLGLNGTGDKSNLARRMIANMMKRENIVADESSIAGGNAAVVMVTAKLDPFRRPGSRIDVLVSSLNDAKSLKGGTLVMTPLKGPYAQEVYALAEGSLIVNGVSAEGASGSSVTVNHPTVGRIPNGALVEKDVPMELVDRRGVITLLLRNQDWTTARNIAAAINGHSPAAARVRDAAAIEVRVPDSWLGREPEFVAEIQALTVEVHLVSKVVIDESTGTIVAGGDVRISTVAVSHGKLSVTISETPEAVPHAPFTEGPGATVVPRSDVAISEEGSGLRVIDGGQSIAKLSESLNALGASPRQLIAILQQIKAAGALHAELVVN